MPFEVIHGNQRLFQRKSQRLGIANAHQQRACQPGTTRHRQRIDRPKVLPCLLQRSADHRHNRFQVLARRQFRHHALIGTMGCEL